MNVHETAASAITPKSAGGWPGQMLAPSLSPSLIADSPVFLPLIMVEPSPTTGIQHMIPPLFHSSAARKALSARAGVLNSPAPAPCPEKCAAAPHEQEEATAVQLVKEESEFSFTHTNIRAGKPSAANTDGWQWRKYGEKIVKGSPNPRSYYKCSNAGCSAKKIVERSAQGELLSSEYRGDHCHPAPVAAKSSRFRPKPTIQGSPPAEDKVQAQPSAAAARFGYGAMLNADHHAALHDLLPIPAALQADEGLEERERGADEAQAAALAQALAAVYSCSIPQQQHHARSGQGQANDESPSKRLDALAACAEEAEQQLLLSGCGGRGGGGGGSGSPGTANKRRRRNGDGSPMPEELGQGQGWGELRPPASAALDAAPATASYLPVMHEQQCGPETGYDGGGGGCGPEVMLVDGDKCLDDGYRWRKYGQKQVKGHAYPRSYYKCTALGCPVRKHVERSAAQRDKLLVSYEGQHTHRPPCSASSNNLGRGAGVGYGRWGREGRVRGAGHRPPCSASSNNLGRGAGVGYGRWGRGGTARGAGHGRWGGRTGADSVVWWRGVMLLLLMLVGDGAAPTSTWSWARAGGGAAPALAPAAAAAPAPAVAPAAAAAAGVDAGAAAGAAAGDLGAELEEAGAGEECAGAGAGDGPAPSLGMEDSPLGGGRGRAGAGGGGRKRKAAGRSSSGSMEPELELGRGLRGVGGGGGGMAATPEADSSQRLPPLQQAALSLLPFLQLGSSSCSAPPAPSILNSTLALAAKAALGLCNRSSHMGESPRPMAASPWEALAALVLPQQAAHDKQPASAAGTGATGPALML